MLHRHTGQSRPPYLLGVNRKRLRRLMKEAGIAEWMRDYNHNRIHQGLDYDIPWQRYRPNSGLVCAA